MQTLAAHYLLLQKRTSRFKNLANVSKSTETDGVSVKYGWIERFTCCPPPVREIVS
jgi:hypothetical protein